MSFCSLFLSVFLCPLFLSPHHNLLFLLLIHPAGPFPSHVLISSGRSFAFSISELCFCLARITCLCCSPAASLTCAVELQPQQVGEAGQLIVGHGGGQDGRHFRVGGVQRHGAPLELKTRLVPHPYGTGQGDGEH